MILSMDYTIPEPESWRIL